MQAQTKPDVGTSFGSALQPLFVQYASDDFDPSKLDESAIKIELNKLKQLTDAPPPGFPNDVLVKLKAFAALGSRDHLTSSANLQQFVDAMVELMDTIAPDA